MTPMDIELALLDSAEYLYLRELSVVIPTMRYIHWQVVSCLHPITFS